MNELKTRKPHSNPLFMIIAGESSGDLLGGALVRSMRELLPQCAFFGVGGSSMQKEGVHLIHTIDDLGVTGFSEVCLKIPHVLRVMNRIVQQAKNQKPIAAILIDYPDFNLRLARKLKTNGVPVLYYVSPQMWAWRTGRVKTVQKYVDRMMVLFPFEKEWYRRRNVNAHFVGHPVLDRIDRIPGRSECRNTLGLAGSDILLAMLPGSRYNEVNRMLPVFLQAREQLMAESSAETGGAGNLRFVIAAADTISEQKLHLVGRHTTDKTIRIIRGDTLSVLRAADFAWVTSGTAALETALIGTPHAVLYRTSPLTFLLARLLIHVKYISLANLMLDRQAVPELIQGDCTADRLVAETRRILHNEADRVQMTENLALLRNRFGRFNASGKAAEIVLQSVNMLPDVSGETGP
jgi:lipid-A-disaccharide synthase